MVASQSPLSQVTAPFPRIPDSPDLYPIGALRFTFTGYNKGDAVPGPHPFGNCSGADVHADINSWGGLLDAEISQIEAVWPKVPLVVMGHSQGGLIAASWWGSKHTAVNNYHVFTLDSPINGACAALSGITPCAGPPSYPTYEFRQFSNPQMIKADADQGWPIRFLGTYGDSPAGGYGAGPDTLQHQLLFDYSPRLSSSDINRACGNPSNERNCPIAPSDFVTDPGCLTNYDAPGAHYVVKHCPSNLVYINDVLRLKY